MSLPPPDEGADVVPIKAGLSRRERRDRGMRRSAGRGRARRALRDVIAAGEAVKLAAVDNEQSATPPRRGHS